MKSSTPLIQILLALLLLMSHTPVHAAPSTSTPEETATIEAGKWIPLYPTAPKDSRPELWLDPTRITNIFTPQIQFYFPSGWTPKDKRPLLCIFPGGGYALQAIIKEGTQIAQWANSMGMVAAVIKYRVAQNDPSLGRFPGPLLDARRAIRLARSQAEQLGINPKKIGIIGFSAGGHVAAMATTLWNKKLTQEQGDSLISISARPDFSMLIYPVISMDATVTHEGTRKAIAGDSPTPDELRLCSPDKNVTSQTPPIFLVHAKNDPVSFQHSELMEKACLQHGTSVTKMIYTTGGHGYGLNKQGTSSDQWPQDAKQWLKAQQLILCDKQ